MPLCLQENNHIQIVKNLIKMLVFRFRWIFIVFFLLPVGFLCNVHSDVRNWFIFNVNSASKAHNRKVAIIQKQIRDWQANGKKLKMCTARVGWSTISFRSPTYKHRCQTIKIDQLIDILEIDIANGVVRVEPGVTIRALSRRLLPLGFTLPVLPEPEDLTIGGLVNGTGVQSSSVRYGLFQHICTSYQIITPDGTLITASRKMTASDEKQDNNHQALFYGLPWSQGTLGFVVSITLRMIACRPFVRLFYRPYNSLNTLEQMLQDECRNCENDFIEALAFSLESGVVVSGKFSEKPSNPEQKINPIAGWNKPWFFAHVEDILTAEKTLVEFVPVQDYYRRHSRSIFWLIKELIPFGNHPIYRFILGWMGSPKISLLKLATSSTLKRFYEDKLILQNFLIPMTSLQQALQLLDLEVMIYPLWLCPYSMPSAPGMVRQRTGKNQLCINIGVYGMTEKSNYQPVETTRKFEQFLRSVHGVKMLHGDNRMSRGEFWEMFDSTFYEWLRCKYRCKDAFPNVYDKVSIDARQ